MEVTVNLYGELRAYLPVGKPGAVRLRVPTRTTVRDLLNYLHVPADLPLAVVVNGAHRDKDYRVADADVLSVFSMAAFKDAQTH
ncbi:MAG: MoaD/ThiS family protein [Chloroflexota bacterium]|nr:MoaD/ThiS family protein [Chloroflexota bacterium]